MSGTVTSLQSERRERDTQRHVPLASPTLKLPPASCTATELSLSRIETVCVSRLRACVGGVPIVKTSVSVGSAALSSVIAMIDSRWFDRREWSRAACCSRSHRHSSPSR